MEDISSNNTCTRPMLERKARPQEQLNCPRCNSTNTKFCYYNNYSLNQPRYFCKTCRRYWTEGGSLRNVPVGGGSRKNKRSISSSSSASASATAVAAASSASSKVHDLIPPSSFSHFSSAHQNPKTHEGQDLNLAFPAMQETQALELLRTGIASRGLNSFIPTPIPDSNSLYNSGFPVQEYKPSLSFSLDHHHHHHHHGLENRYGTVEDQNNGGGRILFPLGELKQFSTTSTEVDHHHHHQNKGQGTSNGYWNGMLGGGGSW